MQARILGADKRPSGVFCLLRAFHIEGTETNRFSSLHRSPFAAKLLPF
jgi:hypothetical protein